MELAAAISDKVSPDCTSCPFSEASALAAMIDETATAVPTDNNFFIKIFPPVFYPYILEILYLTDSFNVFLIAK
ncbi:hypothetical protein [Salinicoccus halitifaciens]|uniref:Uncharacterized protein n=1 Tax=Salinicoccus halitifaciens TaxID=1073415 RepID=A0ABV2E975_9STAP